MEKEPLIKVEHLKKEFVLGKGNVLKAIDDVSFTIQKGKTLGVVGESGCGKTTIGRTILRLYEADSGTMTFDGIDVFNIHKKEYKALTKRMQMIYQDPYSSLDPRFTVGDIVGEGLDIHKLYRNKKERMNRIYELLEMVGLNREHTNRFPHEFSGGQRQRIGIARALAVDPEFIVCDEAISALDVSVQAQVINLLMDLQKSLNLTYLFIAHDLSMVRHISDETIVMYMGCVVEQAITGDLFTNPLHPYTKGLLDSIPTTDPDYEQSKKHTTITGEVTSPTNGGAGCHFCKRCSIATKHCETERPILRDVGNGHFVACHKA